MSDKVYPRGRTTRQAIEAGDSYMIVWRKDDREDGWQEGSYWPVGLGGIAAVVKAAAKLFPRSVGRRVWIERITGGEIGCLFVESAGSVVL